MYFSSKTNYCLFMCVCVCKHFSPPPLLFCVLILVFFVILSYIFILSLFFLFIISLNYAKQNTHILTSDFSLYFRKAAIVDVCGVWLPHHRPVHSEGVPRFRVACRVPQVCGLPPVPRRNMYMLRQGRKDIL